MRGASSASARLLRGEGGSRRPVPPRGLLRVGAQQRGGQSRHGRPRGHAMAGQEARVVPPAAPARWCRIQPRQRMSTQPERRAHHSRSASPSAGDRAWRRPLTPRARRLAKADVERARARGTGPSRMGTANNTKSVGRSLEGTGSQMSAMTTEQRGPATSPGEADARQVGEPGRRLGLLSGGDTASTQPATGSPTHQTMPRRPQPSPPSRRPAKARPARGNRQASQSGNTAHIRHGDSEAAWCRRAPMGRWRCWPTRRATASV